MNLKHNTVRTMLRQGKIDEIIVYGIDAVPVLIKLLGSDPTARHWASKALIKIGKPAVPALIKALEEANPNVKAQAALTLGLINDVTAVPALIAMLRKDDSVARDNPVIGYGAALALGSMGSESTVSALIIVLGDANLEVRKNTAIALEKINDEKGVRFAKLVGRQYINYTLELGLEETGKVLAEFVKLIEKDRNLAKTNRVRLELAEFYGKVVAEHNMGNVAIKVKGGELLRDTVKPPRDRMYRAIERRAMRPT